MKRLISTAVIAILLCFSTRADAQFGRIVNASKNGASNTKTAPAGASKNESAGSSSTSTESTQTTGDKLMPLKKGGNVYEDEAKNEGYTGALHRKYADKAVFSSRPINRDSMNVEPDRYRDKFKASEAIYGRAFLSQPFQRWGKKLFNVTVQIDDNVKPICAVSDGDVILTNDKGEWITTFKFAIVPAKNDPSNIITRPLLEAINNLTPGDHKLKVTVGAGSFGNSTKNPMAESTLTLTVAAGDKIKGMTFEALVAGMADPALTAQALKVVQKHAQSDGWKETFSKAKIKGSRWEIQRHTVTGVILSRYIDVWGYATWPDGHCTIQTYGIKEDYDGAAYGAPYFAGVGNQEKCDCSAGK